MTESMVETSKESSINLTEAPIRVLNVDDDSDFLKITKRILEVIDAFKVDTALSVDEAMDKIKRTEYDVIVSDYQMPVKSGLDFLKELRASGNNVPFVLFTGKGRESLAIQALNFGADQYFNKLGDPETVYGELAHGIRQVVEKRRTEEALKDSEAKYRSFFENAGDAAITLDLKGNITAINRAVEEYGFQKSEIIGKNMRRFVPRRYWPKLLNTIIQVAQKKTVEGKIEINTPTGKRAVEYSSSPITIGDNVVGIQSILKDVSEREKIKETLKESEENYRNMVEMAPDSIMTFNRKGVITSCNTASIRLSGYSKDELLGKHFSKAGVLRARDIPRYLKMLTFTLRGKIPKPFEVVYRHKDGSQAFGDVRMSLMKKKNKIVGIQAIMRDITERKKSDESLQESEERLRNLFESSREGIIITGPEGRITRVNSAAAAMLGYNKSELVGVSAVELYMNPKAREMMFKKLMEKSYVEKYELMAKKKDGSPIHVIASNLTRLDKEGNVLQTEAFFTDITERKKAEATLKESEERFRGAIESSSDIMGIADLNGNIVMVNRAFERVIGFKVDEIVGKPFSTIQPGDQVSVASKAFGTIMREGSINNFELDFMTKKGKRMTTLASGTLLRDAQGKPKEVFLVARDITERKKTYRRLESLNEKLEVVGGLTRHDVNNKLATVMGNVYLVKQELADDHQALKHLSEIELSVGQAKLIFEFARFYEMLGIETLEYVRVEDAFKGACKQFSDLRVTVVNDYGGLRVLADSLLSRLFYNLIDNSLKHGEKITKIRVYYEEFGDNLHLVYEDDGVGIPQAEKEKIFEQDYGLYTGYGLYLIRKMCEAYGWTIKETGQPKKGAKFTMTLPQTNVYEGKTSYRLPK